MPYKSTKIKIAGTKFDRRIKLTAEQKGEVKFLYAKGNTSERKLAKQFNVSRRLISMILHPERKKKFDNKKYYDKDRHSKYMREHRNYKQKLYKEDKIKW